MAHPHHQPPAEEPVIESGGFEADLFWEKYRATILGSIAVVIIAVVGTALWLYNDYNTRQAAQSAFAEAKNPDAWREIIAKYPKSDPAADAYFLLAESLREQGNVTESTATYEKFLEVFPKHPLDGGARLGIAENATLGKNPSEALEAWHAIKLKDPTSYAAPFALLLEGRALMREGKLQEARKVFSALTADYAQSPPAQIASQHLDQLSSLIIKLPAQ